MQDAISGTNLLLCGRFQQNPFSSFGGDASGTDKHTDGQTDIHTDRQTGRQAGRQTAKTLQQSFCWLDLRCRWSEQRRSWRSQRSSYSSHSTVRNSTHPTHAVQCKYTPTLLVREMNYSNVDCYYYHLFHRNSIPYFHFRKLPL